MSDGKSKSKGKDLEEKLRAIKVSPDDVQAVAGLIKTLSGVFGMQAGMIKKRLQQRGMDVVATIHYCPETREDKAVILGLKLIFPKKSDADYFMACIMKAQEGGE